MTDTEKLEIEKEALLVYADRLRMQVLEKQFEIDRIFKATDKAHEQSERVLEQSNEYLDKVGELQIKNDKLEADLLSLHKTLEKTESELAKIRSNATTKEIELLQNQVWLGQFFTPTGFVCTECNGTFKLSEVKVVGGKLAGKVCCLKCADGSIEEAF